MPLITLFSGMRLQEICQLEVVAIGYSEDIAFISTEWDIAETVDDHETAPSDLRPEFPPAFVESLV